MLVSFVRLVKFANPISKSAMASPLTSPSMMAVVPDGRTRSRPFTPRVNGAVPMKVKA